MKLFFDVSNKPFNFINQSSMKNGINFLHLPVLKLKEAIYIIYASFEISPFKNNSLLFLISLDYLQLFIIRHVIVIHIVILFHHHQSNISLAI